MGDGGKRTIELDPEDAPLITKLFEWYATGTCTLDEVVEKAHDAGFVYKKSKQHVSRAAIHKLLTNQMFTGTFLWKGELRQGNYQALVSEELWQKVQTVLRSRSKMKPRFVKHEFAYSHLLTCGHCGCSQVGELKKEKYIYYHCTGFKGKCPEPFVREEVLGERFADVLRTLVFDEEVLELVRKALRESHEDVRKFHDQAISRLQAENKKIQNRVDMSYTDKVDGLITAEFFKEKTDGWREEQKMLLVKIAQHQQANQNYLEEGVQLLELTSQLPALFANQPAKEKRRLQDFVFSNSTWANGKLAVQFRQPFDLLAVTNESWKQVKVAGTTPDDLHPEKLPE